MDYNQMRCNCGAGMNFIGARKCNGCGIVLCAQCKREWQRRPYCKRCWRELSNAKSQLHNH